MSTTLVPETKEEIFRDKREVSAAIPGLIEMPPHVKDGVVYTYSYGGYEIRFGGRAEKPWVVVMDVVRALSSATALSSDPNTSYILKGMVKGRDYVIANECKKGIGGRAPAAAFLPSLHRYLKQHSRSVKVHSFLNWLSNVQKTLPFFLATPAEEQTEMFIERDKESGCDQIVVQPSQDGASEAHSFTPLPLTDAAQKAAQFVLQYSKVVNRILTFHDLPVRSIDNNKIPLFCCVDIARAIDLDMRCLGGRKQSLFKDHINLNPQIAQVAASEKQNITLPSIRHAKHGKSATFLTEMGVISFMQIIQESRTLGDRAQYYAPEFLRWFREEAMPAIRAEASGQVSIPAPTVTHLPDRQTGRLLPRETIPSAQDVVAAREAHTEALAAQKAAQQETPAPPDGYRFLKEGEIIPPGAKFVSSAGSAWRDCDVSIGRVNTGAIYTRIAPIEPVDTQASQAEEPVALDSETRLVISKPVSGGHIIPTHLAEPTSQPGVSVMLFDGNRVRTGGEGESRWFCVADVLRAIDDKPRPDKPYNVTEATKDLDEDELMINELTDSTGRKQDMPCVLRSGLFYLLGRSRKPAGKKFYKWVRKDVLEAIDSHGTYTVPGAQPAQPALEDPRMLAALEDIERKTDEQMEGIQGLIPVVQNGVRLVHEHETQLVELRKAVAEQPTLIEEAEENVKGHADSMASRVYNTLMAFIDKANETISALTKRVSDSEVQAVNTQREVDSIAKGLQRQGIPVAETCLATTRAEAGLPPEGLAFAGGPEDYMTVEAFTHTLAPQDGWSSLGLGVSPSVFGIRCRQSCLDQGIALRHPMNAWDDERNAYPLSIMEVVAAKLEAEAKAKLLENGPAMEPQEAPEQAA